MRKVCVFCSSHTDLPSPVVEATRSLGRALGQAGLTLVFGGSRRGLMEVLATAVKQNGGRVVGVIPRYMVELGGASQCCDEVIEVDDLCTRKQRMIAEADCFVALPGGVGTLDELTAVYASSVVGEHRKPMYVVNIGRYWTPLLSVFRHFEESGMSRMGLFGKRVNVVNTVDELVELLKEAKEA